MIENRFWAKRSRFNTRSLVLKMSLFNRKKNYVMGISKILLKVCFEEKMVGFSREMKEQSYFPNTILSCSPVVIRLTRPAPIPVIGTWM